MKVLTVTIKDSNGGSFSKNWAITANKLDAIRWTISSEDVPHYLDVDAIKEVTVRTTFEGVECVDEKVEQIAKLAALYELLSKCQELVQGEGIVGGHRGNVDSLLMDAKNEAYEALETAKKELYNKE